MFDNLSILELKGLAYDKQKELFKHRQYTLGLEKLVNQIVAIIDEKETQSLEIKKPEKNKIRASKE